MYRKDFSGLGFRMACSAVLILAIQTAGQYIVAAINPDWAENMDIMLAATMVPLYVLGYPLAFLILRSKEKLVIEKH